MSQHQHSFICREDDHGDRFICTVDHSLPYVGKRRDVTVLGILTAAARDNVARYLPDPPYVGTHRHCDTCVGTGLVDWAPFQHRDSEEDQQPCPDCVARRPKVGAA